MRNRPNAFTLIELLIVVAIIAILAAIAVPNFLEAQVRSKVSRAKNDLRTLAVGLESYAVDNNTYPYAENLVAGNQPWLPPGGRPIHPSATQQCGGVTSPIAYLTKLPIDVFEHPIAAGITAKAPVYYEKAGFTIDDGNLNTARASQVPADAVGVYMKLDGIGPDQAVTDAQLTPARWVLYSLGPDIRFHLHDASDAIISRSRYNLNNRYDPTNGTVSAGNILQYPGGTTFP